MKLRIRTFELPLRHTFRISRGSVSEQSTLIVELEHDGLRGYGEATTSRYYNQSIEGMASVIRAAAPQIGALVPEHANAEWPAAVWADLDQALCHSRFAQCAVDEALWDLFGKLRGQSLCALWGLDPAKAPPSDYTIGIDSIDVMRQKLQEFHDWPIFKIKLGAENDADVLRAMRAETTAKLRVDANCGWNFEKARIMIPVCQECGVEFIEQPYAANEVAAMRQLKSWSPLPLVADESCVVEPDVENCVGQFHGVNIKLMKCGGLTPARRMIAKAREFGLSVMLGCMTESTIGISALAQLAPLADAIDMDGAVLLARDVASGVRVERGVVHYAESFGSGVPGGELSPDVPGREIT
jgi:L-alanine-DL-glutamate epimerase-like enolase superfamily enzyme